MSTKKKKNKTDTEKEEALETVEESTDTLKNRIKELEEEFLRLAAEFDNYRKRQSKEREVSISHSISSFLRDFLPIIEDIKRASNFTPKTEEGARICEGICMVYKKITDFLQSKGVRKIEINPGDEFDPALMDAVSIIDSTTEKPHTVIEVVEDGYLLGDTLIRPSKVVVSKRPSEVLSGE